MVIARLRAWLGRRHHSAAPHVADRDDASADDLASPPVILVDDMAEADDTAATVDPGGQVAICAILKNEALNVLEWIAYHRAIGVERFFLYDNNSTDDIAALLAPLIAAGIVDYAPWSLAGGQVEAYGDCVARVGHRWRWIAFIDLDEFINIFDGSSIQEFLGRFPDAGGVALQWLNFGSDGHEVRPRGLQMLAYRHRFPWHVDVHRLVKTILRTEDYVAAFNPHAFHVRRPMVEERGGEATHELDLYSAQVPHDPVHACINHYYTRSHADYLAKIARGRGDSAEIKHEYVYDIYVANATVYDDRILARLPAVRSSLRELAKLGCDLGSLADEVAPD